MDTLAGSTNGRPLPTGTVTFLFSDIEGSTQRWERDRAAMADAVERHDALMRSAIEANGGVVFKTIGDAFCAAFALPAPAVQAAADAQAALAGEDFAATGGIAVRMAVHCGTAHERDGDYFGPDVNRVARLLAVGHGGQVLLSGAAAELTMASLPARATLRDLGQHRLKDLHRPEQVYQLVGPMLRADFPPLRSLDRLPNNLPEQLSSFVGRERELAEVEALLSRHRLVTLVGAGGVGKTRFSLQIAANLLDGSAGGVWFVEFAPLVDGAGVPNAVAAALRYDLQGSDPVASLAALLGDVRRLLVFDNCEHVIGTAARLADALLRRCPGIVILASSRQPLGVDGEAVYRMPSLSVPEHIEAAGDIDDARAYSAVALFEERARLADRRFELTAETLPVVVDICAVLDGIPLAIELAAARTAVLGVEQIRRRLDQRFRLLQGSSRTALPRQQTLRALIDWSYDLLDARERLVFERLGIFAGSFTLESAADICSDEAIDDLDVFDLLASLVDKSLVVAEVASSSTRYRLLESMRAYARERLAGAGTFASLAERHLTHYRDRAVAARVSFERSIREDEFASLQADLDDVRVALEWSLSPDGDTLGGADLYANMLWLTHAEPLRWGRLFLERNPTGDPIVEGRLALAVYALLSNHGDKPAADAAIAKGLALGRSTGDRRLLGRALAAAASADAWSADLSGARSHLAELSELIGSAPTAFERERFLFARGMVSLFEGDFDQAAADYGTLLEEDLRRGSGYRIDALLLNLAEAEFGRGRYDRALAAARQNIAIAEPLGKYDTMFVVYASACATCVAAGDLEEALAMGRAGAALAPEWTSDFRAATFAEALGALWAERGDSARAARLNGFAQAVYDRSEALRETQEKRMHERLVAMLSAVLEPAEWERLASEGATWTREEALAAAVLDADAAEPAELA